MNKLFCKSFLSIYHLVPKLVKSIDRLVLVRGINSSSYCGGAMGSNLEGEINKLINLSQRKINLINLKVIVDEILVEMKPKHSKLIIAKYIDLIENKKAIELSKLNRRTYYRTLNKAIDEFEHLFVKRMLQNKKLYSSIFEEATFSEILNKITEFQKQSNEQVELRNMSNTICNFIVNKLNKAV